MQQHVRYHSYLRALFATALLVFALGGPATSAFAVSAESRADGGIPLSTSSDRHSAAGRADGGVALPSSSPVTTGGESDGGIHWAYFAGGGLVLAMLVTSAAAATTRRRRVARVRASAAH